MVAMNVCGASPAALLAVNSLFSSSFVSHAILATPSMTEDNCVFFGFLGLAAPPAAKTLLDAIEEGEDSVPYLAPAIVRSVAHTIFRAVVDPKGVAVRAKTAHVLHGWLTPEQLLKQLQAAI